MFSVEQKNSSMEKPGDWGQAEETYSGPKGDLETSIDSFDRTGNVCFDHFQPLWDTFSVFTLGNVDIAFGQKLPFYDQFTAGGLTDLDAYRYQELHAHSALAAGGGLILPRHESQECRFPPLSGSLVPSSAVGSAEQGWQTRQSTSVGLFAPTSLGITGLILKL
jgi:hypothetical protein